MLTLLTFSCQVPDLPPFIFSHIVYSAQLKVILSMNKKVSVNLLESKKISFTTSPRHPGAKPLTKLTLKKRGV
jgi:hypothetical protein